MILAIAIDDEPSAIEVIKHHVSKLKNIELKHHFHDPEKALEYLKKNPVDLIFLDINMPKLSGLEMLESLQRKPEVIFTTAYSEFAVDSYAYNAIDYLLKPFEFERFQIAIQKAEEKIVSQQNQSTFFFVKDGFKNIKIAFDDIQFIKSSGNYLDIHTSSKVHSPRMTFSDLFLKLPKKSFLRTHQSYVIHVNAVEKVENNHIYIGDEKIPISSSYKEELYRRFDL